MINYKQLSILKILEKTEKYMYLIYGNEMNLSAIEETISRKSTNLIMYNKLMQ